MLPTLLRHPFSTMRSPCWAMVLLLGALLCILPSCTYESSGLSDITCEEGDPPREDGAVCVDGIYVAPTDAPDMPEDTGLPDADMPLPPSDMKDMCIPETAAELCTAASAECGILDAVIDTCGMSRMPDCGTCMGADNACVDNTCTCEAETDAELCATNNADCGVLTVDDRCSTERTVDCGMCMGNDTCANNVCEVCQAETDDALCTRAGATCGTITVTDSCGMERTIGCGMCTGDDDICTAANACECQAEDDATFCGRLGAQCGSVTDQDNCGDERTVNCGMCDSGTCEPNNTCSVCMAETDSAFCARLNKDCGMVASMDNCMKSRTVDCGGCSNDRTCDGSNQCVCPTPGCANAECGPVSNACGNSNNCGTCGANQMCDNTNTCVCQPKTDAQLCSDEGAGCGMTTVTDNCGAQRTIMCGSCPSGDVCTANSCCTPQTDAAFCMAQGAQCGSVTGMDNCGQSRTLDCGSCGANENCTNNTCQCVPETDTQLCMMNNATCGDITVTDRCGAQRTVTCGGCSTDEVCQNNSCTCPTPTCGNNACGMVSNACGNSTPCGSCATDEMCNTMATPNACVCMPETDAELCTDAGAQCGTVATTDRCGVSRTAICQSCPSGDVCNGTVCCTPVSDSRLCSNNGAQCGPLTVADDGCGQMRMITCGTCTNASDTCDANNQCVCTPDDAPTACEKAGGCGMQTLPDGCGGMKMYDCLNGTYCNNGGQGCAGGSNMCK